MSQTQYLKIPNTLAILPIARILFLMTSRRAALAALPPVLKQHQQSDQKFSYKRKNASENKCLLRKKSVLETKEKRDG